MELKILSAQNQQKGMVKLPVQFEEQVRPDLINRAVRAIFANSRQPYGAKTNAGLQQSTDISRRRRDYKTSYGHGISRVPRKIMSRRGTQFGWMAAAAPGTTKGRRAHPPKAAKIWDQKINVQEKRKAIRSAISATLIKELVTERGHHIPPSYPFALDDSVEHLKKTQQVHDLLLGLGLSDELDRSMQKKIRAGVGKSRSRPYKKRKGPLLVVSGQCPLINSAKNIPGVDVICVHKLNALALAPGGFPARLTLFTHKAVKLLEEKKMFMSS